MAGNPKTSAWYSTPQAKRKRKGLEVTLSDEAREKLDALAAAWSMPRSQVVEALVMAAKKRR
jgi:predicted transcriptional regulator